MIRNYFLITFRSLMKNKLFIIINVFGMGIAIACCIVGYLSYEYDADFDTVHQNGKSIYRVSAIREFDHKLTRYAYAALPLGNIVDKTFQDVDQSSRYFRSWSNFKRENDLFAANLSYVDPDFFKMFSFDFIAGQSADLQDVSSIFISKNMAIKLFGTPEEAFGKSITQVYGTELKEVKVAGVFNEPPMNSSFYKSEGSAFMNFENCPDEFKDMTDDNWRKESMLFVEVRNPSRASRVHQQLQSYRQNNNEVREDFQVSEYALDSFTAMAHRDRSEDVVAQTWPAPPLSAVIGSMIMGVLILLISCFNLTNTAIAISSRRLREIGIRKVMGSMRIQLIVQFISETTFICFMALLAGLAIGDLLIAGWNIMTANNIHITPHYSLSFILFLAGVLLFTGIVAGSYPAFYISKFNPVSILKGKLKFGGTNYFTRILLGAQFAISLISIVSAIGFLQNANFQREYDLGFDIRGSVIAWVKDENEFDTYRNALQTNPQILSVAGAQSGIFSSHAHEAVKYQSAQAEVDIIDVGDHYLKTMNLTLTEGRDFIKDSKTDQRESIIITQKMAKLFGWDEPLGKEITWRNSQKLFVVGVVKDIYTQGLWRELEPMMIRYVPPAQYTQIVVNAKAENVSAVNDFMNDQWTKVFPNRLYNGYMMGTDLKHVSDLNESIVYGYGFLGLVALLLSVTGLFSLVSLNILKRMKEIGVRKVLGASVFNITRVINREFIIVLMVAALLGSWAGYTWSSVIMGTIWKYYQGVNAMTFIIAIGLLFIVCFCTIGFKVFSVATMNPVKTLQDE
jgi:putative ABC transport system permease protein